MNSHPDSDSNQPLLEATLRDGDWAAAAAACKQEALRVFRVHERRRRLARWAGGGLILGLLLSLGAWHWPGRPARPPAPPAAPVAADASPQHPYLTDEELLAAFPPGSCFLAEVNGRKQLVFADPKVEQVYLRR